MTPTPSIALLMSWGLVPQEARLLFDTYPTRDERCILVGSIDAGHRWRERCWWLDAVRQEVEQRAALAAAEDWSLATLEEVYCPRSYTEGGGGTDRIRVARAAGLYLAADLATLHPLEIRCLPGWGQRGALAVALHMALYGVRLEIDREVPGSVPEIYARLVRECRGPRSLVPRKSGGGGGG